MLTEEMWGESALFPYSEGRVRKMITLATEPQAHVPTSPIVVIGVIGEPGQVEASTGLIASQFWYTEAWHIEDVWHFVCPKHRKTKHSKHLLNFSKEVQKSLALPLVMGVLSDVRTEAKARLYSREFGKPVGAVFVWPTVQTLKQQIKAKAA